ncbi:Uncharacterised protein [Vibrio cholerae]|nr:Uncharacterised protein [Vibrio cholerae]
MIELFDLNFTAIEHKLSTIIDFRYNHFLRRIFSEDGSPILDFGVFSRFNVFDHTFTG